MSVFKIVITSNNNSYYKSAKLLPTGMGLYVVFPFTKDCSNAFIKEAIIDHVKKSEIINEIEEDIYLQELEVRDLKKWWEFWK